MLKQNFKIMLTLLLFFSIFYSSPIYAYGETAVIDKSFVCDLRTSTAIICTLLKENAYLRY